MAVASGLEATSSRNVSISAFALWGGLVFYVLARELFKFRQRAPSSSSLASPSANIIYIALQVSRHSSPGWRLPVASIAGSFRCSRGRRPTGRELAGAMLLIGALRLHTPHAARRLPTLAFYSISWNFRQTRFAGYSGRRFDSGRIAGVFALSPSGGKHRSVCGLMNDVVAGWSCPGFAGSFAWCHRQQRISALAVAFEAMLAVLALG